MFRIKGNYDYYGCDLRDFDKNHWDGGSDRGGWVDGYWDDDEEIQVGYIMWFWGVGHELRVYGLMIYAIVSRQALKRSTDPR